MEPVKLCILTDEQIDDLTAEVEPLCDGDTTDLRDWIAEGNRVGNTAGVSAADIAAEWNEYTQQALGE